MDRLKRTHKPNIDRTRIMNTWQTKKADVVLIVTIEKVAPIMRKIADTIITMAATTIKSGGTKRIVMIWLS